MKDFDSLKIAVAGTEYGELPAFARLRDEGFAYYGMGRK